jgi:hypothetical protein
MSATPNDSRNVVAQGAIILSICVGGYMALVDGPRQKAAQAQSECAAIAAQLKEAESLRDQVPAFTALRERCKTEGAALAECGRLAREERELFAAIMSLADQNRVTIDGLNPAKATGKQAAAPGQPEAPDARDVTVAYSISATASYPAMASFLRSLRTGLGHAQVRSVRLVPSAEDKAQLVRAVIETEHYAFDTTPPPATGTADGARHAEAGEQ